MAAVLVGLARCVLIATLLAAPWAIGGAELRHQRWLFLGVLVAGALGWLGCVWRSSARLSRHTMALLLPGALLIAIGGVQLAPHPHAPDLQHAQLTGALQVLDGRDSPTSARSLSTADTRLQIGRLSLALCALLTAAWLFRERGPRYWLWAMLTLNGTALVIFGLVQRASWDGKLYWTIPLELGGQPFASFVNRNNAAEYLSMCLASALGLWASRRTVVDRPTFTRKERTAHAHSRIERIPSTTWAIALLVLFGGVLATLSRAGAMSAVAGLLVIGAWAATGGRTRTVMLPLLGIVVAAAAWIGVSQQRSLLQARLSTVTRALENDGRVGHWTDMLSALRDFPTWGAGLGVYRYTNKPYESRKSEAWFESADNQYLELIVDAGVGGAVALVAWLLAAVAGVVAWRRCGHLGEACAGGYLLIAIGLQSIADCWWMTSANLLTLASLAGALASPARALDDPALSPLDKVRRLIDSRGGLATAAIVGLCLLAAACAGLYEVSTAADAASFRGRLPDDDQLAETPPGELDGFIAAGERLVRRRPDDAALHAALARLYYDRYRLSAAEALNAVAPQRWTAAARWERTSPQALFATLARYRQSGDASAIKRIGDAPAVQEHLTPMAIHLDTARRSCPILPHLGLLEAIAALIASGDPAPALRREAALNPASPKRLHSLAQSAEMIEDAMLFETCLTRCLELDPAQLPRYVDTARRRLPEPQIVERLLPAAPQPMLDFAEVARSPAGRQQAIDRAAELIETTTLTEGEALWLRGRIALFERDSTDAVSLLKQAVDAAGINPDLRIDYARALHAAGDNTAAASELAAARRLAPQDRRIESRARAVESLISRPRS